MAENKTHFIVDASVLLKWFLDEELDAGIALSFRSDFLKRKISLSMLDYTCEEFFNTIAIKFEKKKALSALSLLHVYSITECSVSIELASIAADLMAEYRGISFYDAGYHALAKLEGATFITADEKYYNKVAKAGNVMLLKNYGKKR